MRLLIVTQAVDLDDPVLGFFHGWIKEFSKHLQQVSIICLREGRHALPGNVSVYSLGKEEGPSRLKYILRFFGYIWRLRNAYDAVFVHMNQEYVLLGGIFWWLYGKRVVLWRNHKRGSLGTRLAARLAHTVCYTSPSAYVAPYKNAVRMPIGIDTDFFKPLGHHAANHSILFLGRLDAVKKPDVFLEAMRLLQNGQREAHADIYGDPTPGAEAYAQELKARFADLKNATFHPAVRNDQTPALYRSHAIYVNLTPSGSFDKTIGEAAASGSIVVACNDALEGVLPPPLLVDADSAASAERGMSAALSLSDEEHSALSAKLRQHVIAEHSLTLLATRLMGILGS